MFRFAQHDTGAWRTPCRAEWNSPRSATQQRFFFCELACIAEIEPTTVTAMKNSLRLLTLSGALLVTLAFASLAATASQEKAFTDKYKAAIESKDTATLEAFLYTQGSDPAALEFYKMMQSGEAGEKFQALSLLVSHRRTLKKRRPRWTDRPAKFA